MDTYTFIVTDELGGVRLVVAEGCSLASAKRNWSEQMAGENDDTAESYEETILMAFSGDLRLSAV